MEKGGGAAGMGLLGARRQRGAGMGPGVQAGVQAKLSAARKAGVQHRTASSVLLDAVREG